MKTALTITAIALLSCNIAAADVTSKRADTRQHNQKQRIANGVNNGSLTRKETAKLVGQQAHIHRTEKRLESDGVLTKREKARLEIKQDRASRSIYKKKHNKRDRG